MNETRRPRSHCGHAATEYLIVASLLMLAIAIGADRPLEQLARAIADRYQKFSHGISLP
ncbi:MAG TPA: hypothetical protein VM491_01485 [Burkholderiaceae bacterium]|nr:hypothetical protein [Burkholderiaceae bacterium]